MSIEDWNDIPEQMKLDRQKKGNVIVDNKILNRNLYAYDAFNKLEDGSYSGFANEDDFVASIILNPDAGAQFNIYLKQSTVLPSPIIRVQTTGTRTIYNDNESEDFALGFYSKERLELKTNIEFKLNKKLVFFSLVSIYKALLEDELTAEIKDIEFYILDSFEPTYDANGKFSFANLVLKKVNPYTTKRQTTTDDGQIINVYMRLNFFRFNLQPKNVKRIRKTYKSPPIIGVQTFNSSDSASLPVPFKLTKNSDNGYENLFADRKQVNASGFYPLGTQELYYGKKSMDDARIMSNKVQGVAMNEVHGAKQLDVAGVPKFDGQLNPFGNNGDGFLKAIPVYSSNSSHNYKYKTEELLNNITIGNFDEAGLKKTAAEAIKYSLPNGYDLFGLFVSGTSNGENVIPRALGSVGYGYSQTDQLLYFADYGYANVLNVIFEKRFGVYYQTEIVKNEKVLEYINAAGQIPIYEPYLKINEDGIVGSDLRIENLAKLLNRSLNGLGTSGSEFPTSIITENAINTSDAPINYDPAKLNSMIGIGPYDVEQTLEKCDGKDFSVSTSLTTETDTGQGLFQYLYNFSFVNEVNFKLISLPYNLFFEEDHEKEAGYVIEYEFDIAINLLTKDDQYYYGGYEERVEYFSNSYEDSLINGDVNCVVDIEVLGETIKLPLADNIYTAENLSGNPLARRSTRIYGSSNPTIKQKKIIKFNIKNKGKIAYNVETGDKLTEKGVKELEKKLH